MPDQKSAETVDGAVKRTQKKDPRQSTLVAGLRKEIKASLR